jgi:putative nucleotidyltransferase with HDIG domain
MAPPPVHHPALPEAPPRSGDAPALLERAQKAEREAQQAVARHLYEQALWVASGSLAPRQVCAALTGIARTHHVDGNSDAALDVLEVAITIGERTEDYAAIGAALNVRAVIYWQRGRLDDAEQLYHEVQRCGERSADRRLVAMTAHNQGIIATVRGEFSRALAHHRRSLAAFRELGQLRDACSVLNNMGMVYTDLHRWADAEKAFNEAIELCGQANDAVARLLIDVNVAELAIAKADYERARHVCEASLQRARSLGDQRAEAELRKHLGVVARETGYYANAETHFTLAEALAAARGDVLLQAELARERADLLSRQGRFRETVQNLNRAHALFAELRARHDLADVDRRSLRIESMFLDVVRQWGESIESQDAYTQGHCLRVADLACAIAGRLGLDERRLFWFRVGALLHDVGKINVPAEILNKAGPLTSEEWALMRSHPEAGVELLRGIDFPEDVVPIVLSHHEKWDGSGYPHGLAGEAIPIAARVLGLADVYDALTTKRSYKPGLTHEAAMETMRRDVGAHFDPALFRVFEDVMSRRAISAA